MGKTEEHPLKEFYGDIHGTYDRINRIFTFGRDVSWRKKAASECLRFNPEKVLDICTGTGDFILELAGQVSEGVSLTGYDFSGAMLEVARIKSQVLQAKSEVPNIAFVEGDVIKMPFKNEFFDALGITFGIRNLIYENSNADRHLAEMCRVLRPGGQLVILESSRPQNGPWRLLNSAYLQFFLPYLGGMISGNLKAYRYLARSSKNYYSMKEMGTILENAGFVITKSEPLFLGSVMLLVALKK
ncbi:MAG: ubiquinone/menaquinone biosynthesis methyltransferase [Bacteroidales bacterium]|nr:ubiquinone/menaquinone biosynthesis methyltransferase [Bacteroidales bacterium]